MKHAVWQQKMRQGNWVALALVLVCVLLLHQPRREARSQGRGQSAGRKPPEPPRPTELYAESHALVIGVSRYTAGLRSLPGVRRDVAEVALALQRHGFQMTTVEDPTYEQFDQTMRSFIARRGHVFNARLVIYSV